MTLAALPDLSHFPNLASLFDDVFRTKYARRAAQNPDYLYRALCDADERANPVRNELEGLLDAGYRTGIADSDLLGRLKSGNEVGTDSARAELEANYFLTNLGLSVAARPKGLKNRLGDLELRLSAPVFIEIKAVIDREFEAIENRIWNKLIAATESTEGPSVVVMLEMVTAAWDFRTAAYKRWLQDFLQTASSEDEAMYTDASGLVVRAKILGDADPEDDGSPAAMPWTGVRTVHNHDFYRTSLEGAYEQLPDDGRPAIIVLRSFLSFGPDDYGMERAVLGTQSVRIPVNGQAYATRNPDGFFWAAPRNRSSAVGILKSKWSSSGPDGKAELSLDLYHNPMARNPLDWKELHGPGLRHLIAISDTEMKWHE